MTSKTVSVCAVLLAGVLAAFADQPPRAKEPSPEFQQMKKLIGTWQGKTDMGDGPVDLTVQYRLLAAGTVLEERVFPGTTNEMVTMYYDRDGKLALTHYCIMGNRPGMRLKSSTPTSLKFDFDEKCGIDPGKESHMHALSIRFDDADTITTSCTAMINGKASEEHQTTLKRVRS